jgi:hypothetical protein
MNKIYLDKLVDYCQITYHNNPTIYNQNAKKINFLDEIKRIKYNTSLNEKGINLKYNFIELCNFFETMRYNELILLSPISFNLDDIKEIKSSVSKEWYSLLNSLLLLLHDTYINQSNIIKKEILDIANGMYLKKIKKISKIDNEILDAVSNLSSINIIILKKEHNILEIKKIINNKNIVNNKFIVLIYNSEEHEYYPVYNFDTKFYYESDIFINELLKINNKDDQDNNVDEKNSFDEEEKQNKDENKKNMNKEEKKDINKEEKKDINKEEKNKKNNKEDNKYELNDNIISKNIVKKTDELYEEVQTVEDYTLYVSEAVEKTPIKSKKVIENNSDNKKKKNSKNIFIKENSCEEKEDIKKEVNDSKNESIFNKTEILDLVELKKRIENIKLTTKLEEIQEIAIKMNISIVGGSTKEGKPKNKTKIELLKDIKLLLN